MLRRFLLILILLLITPSALAADYEPNQIIVKFKQSKGILSVFGAQPDQKLAKEAGITSSETIYDPHKSIIQSTLNTSSDQAIYLLRSNKLSTEELVKLYRDSGQVEYSEPNYKLTAQFTPNDPLYFYQYAPSNLNMSKAWDIYSPSSRIVKIAVIDSGINPALIEFKDRIIEPTWFSVNNKFSDYIDQFFHGTYVSGLAAAATNNNEGMAGIAGLSSNIKIMPIRILDEGGGGSGSDLVKGINYAVQHHADIINMSLGSEGNSQAIHDAIKDATANHVIVVAAGGNNGNDGNKFFYPAAYPEVIAVAATDDRDLPTVFSNHNDYIKIAAPGSNILSVTPQDEYQTASGTSASAPQISGIAALLLSANPLLDNDKVANILYKTARNVNSTPEYVGAGVADAFAALHDVYNQLLDPNKVTFNGQHYTDEAYRTFKSQLNPPVSTDQKVLSQDMVFQYPDSQGNLQNKTIRFQYQIPRYTLDYVEDKSDHQLAAQCQSDGSVKVNWRKTEDKRYKAVVFDCTNESNFGSCDPGNTVGATEFTATTIYPNGAFVAEALPSGNPMRLSDNNGNYPGNNSYGLFKTQKNRFYSVQLYDQNPDGSGFRAIDGVSTPEFACRGADDTYSSTILYTNPNPYGLEVSCTPDGSKNAGALSWSFTNDNIGSSTSNAFRAVVYDCTNDPTPGCTDDSKNFIAATTPFADINDVFSPQVFTNKGQTFITRPGHKYYVNIFSRPNINSGPITVVEDAIAQHISCR